MKSIALYSRVSTRVQDTAAQDRELERWVQGREGADLLWFRDSATGKTMDRPGWNQLEVARRQREVSTIVVWRLDRLGRTASGLTKLFEELGHEGVNLISLRDSLDLSTPAGRLMANVLASVAQYETEVRADRVRSGIEKAKANGKSWGGSAKGRVSRKIEERGPLIISLAAQGTPIATISRTTGVSRSCIYRLLASRLCL